MGQEDRKREVIEEYLKGGISLRELGRKKGINFRTIHRWVKADKGRALVRGPMPTEIKELQNRLYKAELKNELLEAVIKIAEEEMGIPIRKKSGAKR